MNTTSTDYTVEGLLPNTEYRFTVWSYNRNGRSLRSAEIIATTEAEVAVPEPVTNMRAWATDEESIKVTWEEPAVTNGPITAYKYVLYYIHTNSALWLTQNYSVHLRVTWWIPKSTDLEIFIMNIYLSLFRTLHRSVVDTTFPTFHKYCCGILLDLLVGFQILC